MKKYTKSWALATSAMTFMATAYPVLAQQTPDQPSASTGSDDIVVTARRREESLQSVPVSITALSAETLAQKSVQDLSDVATLTPGFRFSQEGGKGQPSLSLRGLGALPIGEGVPAVVAYFNDVPLSKEGGNIPTFDLANIQILKGPQGTLFGRNTIGGAILINSKKPTFDTEGYLQAGYGNFDYKELEGALNLPLIKDVAALRIAAQYRNRDGRTKNLSPGNPDLDDTNQLSFRASLLVRPTDNLTNTLVFDYFRAREKPAAEVPYRYNAGVLTGILVGGFGFSPADAAVYENDLAGLFAQQQANGPFKVTNDLANDKSGLKVAADRKIWGITNTTNLTLGDVTLRNIFGYRSVYNYQFVNTQGTRQLVGPEGRLVVYHTGAIANKEFITNEFQILGDLGRLNWIAGAFYSKDRPTGTNVNFPQQFSFIDLFGPAVNYSTSQYTNSSFALFGQAGFKITDKLTANAGIRYTWDKVKACAGNSLTGPLSVQQCTEAAALNLPDGTGVVSNKGDYPTWTLGMDYQANRDLFLYVTSRRGIRGVNVNTPLFETPYTTGGIGACLGGANCPDLRPYQKVQQEQVTDFELGMKLNWRAGAVKGRFNVSAYQTKYKNALQFFNVQPLGIPPTAPDQPTRTSIAINASDATVRGVEAELVIEPARWLSLSFSGAYVDQKVDDVKPFGPLTLTKDQVTLPTPKFSGTAAVRAILPVRPMDGELALNADLYHTSAYDAQFGVPLPGYNLVNSRLEWSNIDGRGLSIAGYVRNLFNKQYPMGPAVLLSSFPVNTVYYGDPRTYGLQLTYRFGG
jgi:iron complex outermembrane receptor protein